MLKKVSAGIVGVLLVLVVMVVMSYLLSRKSLLDELNLGSQLADTEIGQIEYRIIGDTGPYILYFHGTPGGYDMPAPRIDGVRIIIPSRPGYLKTPIGLGRSPAEQAKVFANLLDVLEVQSVVLLGGSGGGPAAISFAALFPERTRGLITIAARSLPERLPEDFEAPFFIRSDFAYWMLLSLITRSPEATIQTLVPDPDNQQRILNKPGLAEALGDIAWAIWPFSLRATGWLNDASYFRDLALPIDVIRTPTLIVQGTKDVNVPFENGTNLAEQIENSTLLAVEGADHMVSLSHSDEVQSGLAPV